MEEITAMQLETDPAIRGEIASFDIESVADEQGTLALFIEERQPIGVAGYQAPRCVWRVSGTTLRAFLQRLNQEL